MFGIFDSVETQARKNAAGWLELAEKVHAYRRDELKNSDRLELLQKTENLKLALKTKADAANLKLSIEALEEVLRRTGGKFYPRSTLQEYVEFFVVAAIVLLGMRAYYAQPFKIPTNSMWPTYYGMTPEVFHNPDEAPGIFGKAARLVLFGAQRKEVIAPASGRVELHMVKSGRGLNYARTSRTSRSYYVLPSPGYEYYFRVGGEETSITVPSDFGFDRTLLELFNLTEEQLRSAMQTAMEKSGKDTDVWVDMGVEATQGKPFICFDIMTGDALFVERFSYHFVKPEVGSGFVFRTGNIPGIGSDQYYIKRLVGTPGDTLEVKPPALWRNGAPIEGAEAFKQNANKEGKYRGYSYALNADWLYLRRGEKVVIPEGSYFAMGDNSYNSSDSRAWGFVPYKDVIGRPLFVYYPFTKRWGMPK